MRIYLTNGQKLIFWDKKSKNRLSCKLKLTGDSCKLGSAIKVNIHFHIK